MTWEAYLKVLFSASFSSLCPIRIRVSHSVIFVRNLASRTRCFGRLRTGRAVLECGIDLQRVIDVPPNALPPFFPHSVILKSLVCRIKSQASKEMLCSFTRDGDLNKSPCSVLSKHPHYPWQPRSNVIVAISFYTESTSTHFLYLAYANCFFLFFLLPLVKKLRLCVEALSRAQRHQSRP